MGQRSLAKQFVPPELAQLVDHPPEGEEWIHETKFDGYRTQALLSGNKVSLISRGGHDWTDKYPGIAADLQRLRQRAHLDGEIAFVDAAGRTDFQKLQNALRDRTAGELVYFVFDLLRLNGEDLRSLPLMERKKKLERLLRPLKNTHVRFSDHREDSGVKLYKFACSQKWEGIVSKRKDTPYVSGRSSQWVKTKCKLRQEFVIGGYTAAKGSRAHFGSLLLGVYEGKALRFVGKVGTGFSRDTLSRLLKKLSPLHQAQSPFGIASPSGSDITWLKPQLVAEVAFANWTDEKLLRVPVFQGLRSDKPATQIQVEKPMPTKAVEKPAVRLTHPEKIIYKKEKLTKQDIVDFYRDIRQWILPLATDRPLSLVRCPAGTSKDCFFQRHLKEVMPGIRQNGEGTGLEKFLTLDSIEGLEALVQIGAFELHAWNCHRENVDFPDQIILDLDPDPKLSWTEVIEGAGEVKRLLRSCGLESFVKLSGGKGLHLHAPIQPKYSWDKIRDFTHRLANELEAKSPDRFLSKNSKAARKGKIFVDYLRNGYGASSVLPYSLRARPVSAVALPVTWRELKTVKGSDAFPLERARLRLKKQKRDPWEGMSGLRQSPTRLI